MFEEDHSRGTIKHFQYRYECFSSNKRYSQIPELAWISIAYSLMQGAMLTRVRAGEGKEHTKCLYRLLASALPDKESPRSLEGNIASECGEPFELGGYCIKDSGIERRAFKEILGICGRYLLHDCQIRYG
jgi:hypothetical protein